MYRINKLVKLNRKIYHTNDLAILWKITNKNTLYTTIKRYVKKGILISIYKGLYLTIPLSEIDPQELGKAIIHEYTYLSTESVLFQNGLISQVNYSFTFVAGKSKKITVKDISFLYRRLKDEFLLNPAGIENRDGLLMASPERAVADMLYFNPNYHFDLTRAINWSKVKQIQKEVGYK